MSSSCSSGAMSIAFVDFGSGYKLAEGFSLIGQIFNAFSIGPGYPKNIPSSTQSDTLVCGQEALEMEFHNKGFVFSRSIIRWQSGGQIQALCLLGCSGLDCHFDPTLFYCVHRKGLVFRYRETHALSKGKILSASSRSCGRRTIWTSYSGRSRFKAVLVKVFQMMILVIITHAGELGALTNLLLLLEALLLLDRSPGLPEVSLFRRFHLSFSAVLFRYFASAPELCVTVSRLCDVTSICFIDGYIHLYLCPLLKISFGGFREMRPPLALERKVVAPASLSYNMFFWKFSREIFDELWICDSVHEIPESSLALRVLFTFPLFPN
ncbi:hypothetical protein Tco_1005584 [Tanacetum coccineum]|uniref:Uncharacterized protein n=1 Tax=Tanacetum coccineum TaxID=301880 RepID=A0ABQ5FFH7_9ASTR